MKAKNRLMEYFYCRYPQQFMIGFKYPEPPAAGNRIYSDYYSKTSLVYGCFKTKNRFKKTGLKISEKKFYRLLNVLI